MKKKTLLALSLLLSSVFTFGSFTGCFLIGDSSSSNTPNTSSSSINDGDENDNSGEQGNSGNNTNKTVASIAIKQLPNKTEYYVDEVFSLEGGIITVTYEDGSTGELPMTDEAFTVNRVGMNMAGSKNVTIKFGNSNKIKVSFKVTVRVQGFKAYFDLNYEGAPQAEGVNIVKGFPPEKPANPTRAGYTFYNWYVDKACTVLYDFYKIVDEDTTIYAKWKEDNVIYHTVTYDLNYYGCKILEYEQIVKEGDKAAMLAVTPERVDYRFDGWYTDIAGTSAFNMDTAITKTTKIYAKWTKTKTGTSTYVFEAENTDLSEKKGPGYSGENAGFGMAQDDPQNLGASGGKSVSYMYKYGNSLEFYVASDQDVSNVTLTVRLACEYNNILLKPDIYEISVNGQPINYSDINLTLLAGKEFGNFNDYVVSTTVNLKKGENLIQLKTINNISMGPTLFSTAPVIDCIKLTTDAVIIWDGTHGLPAGL